jgi:hypothetical protein
MIYRGKAYYDYIYTIFSHIYKYFIIYSETLYDCFLDIKIAKITFDFFIFYLIFTLLIVHLHIVKTIYYIIISSLSLFQQVYSRNYVFILCLLLTQFYFVKTTRTLVSF